MSSVFPRHCHQHLPTAIRGEGCYIFDTTGKRYLDGSGGAAVSCLGHDASPVRDAMRAQIDRLSFAHTAFMTSEPAEALAELLARNAPGRLSRVYLVSGGSEAIEASIKLARQYFLERGEPSRHRIIGRRQSYHGSTIGALSAGGSLLRRARYGPLLTDSSHISPCYAYRGKRDNESDSAYGRRVADELETELCRIGPETVMAFVAEPVVGATLGAVPPVSGYWRRVRDICDRHGILLILDEVMCGMGRTGSLFACEQDGIAPDIVAVAKGLGAGYQPLGAMLCSEDIYGAIASGSGAFEHGHTCLGHPVAAAAGHAVLTMIIEDDLPDRVMTAGRSLQSALADSFGKHPHVGDIRGRGLLRALELVSDRQTKTPFDPNRKLAPAIRKAALDAGLICYPISGTVDGVRGEHILLAPPYIITDAQVDELVGKLDQALSSVL
ncbi:MAG: aspartate aminotransferase family protein [Paracoccaceae bacterium]|nr:aspartate aminotransferase family protein [Paracoccaceae bacterium]